MRDAGTNKDKCGAICCVFDPSANWHQLVPRLGVVTPSGWMRAQSLHRPYICRPHIRRPYICRPYISVDHTSVDHTSVDHTSVDHTSVDHTSVDHTSVDHRSVDHILTLHMHRSKEQMREDTSKPLKIELLYLFCLLFICQFTGAIQQKCDGQQVNGCAWFLSFQSIPKTHNWCHSD